MQKALQFDSTMKNIIDKDSATALLEEKSSECKGPLNMKDIDDKSLDALSASCKIKLSTEEGKALLVDLEKILDYAHMLDKIDTTGIAPCYHVVEDVTNVVREDDPKNTIDKEGFIKNLPSSVGGMIKVPEIIEDK